MIQILGLSAISLLAIKYFSPVQPIREKFVGWLIKVMIKRNWWWLESVIKVFSCSYCFSFWMTLIITLNLFKASIVAILTLLILNVLEALNKYLYENDDDE